MNHQLARFCLASSYKYVDCSGFDNCEDFVLDCSCSNVNLFSHREGLAVFWAVCLVEDAGEGCEVAAAAAAVESVDLRWNSESLEPCCFPVVNPQLEKLAEGNPVIVEDLCQQQ